MKEPFFRIYPFLNGNKKNYAILKENVSLQDGNHSSILINISLKYG